MQISSLMSACTFMQYEPDLDYLLFVESKDIVEYLDREDPNTISLSDIN